MRSSLADAEVGGWAVALVLLAFECATQTLVIDVPLHCVSMAGIVMSFYSRSETIGLSIDSPGELLDDGTVSARNLIWIVIDS